MITDPAASAMVTGSRLCPRLPSRVPALIPLYDIDCSLKRELGERAASAKAMASRVPVAHAELADRYADRA
ncbi:hypothetical protein GCM10008023_29270 [Sphingomonas glacialis]|uniref:Uncharacterized protein n=1 Tax=Sphingomonas glacialis TaxID=658225 RepID=A0ABQ3LNP7_9SPHN|nr:hypothetical protein GCM10008023_29270 [Sphingomonas glacialis]